MKNNFISKLDHNIFNYELQFESKKNKKTYKNYLMKIYKKIMKNMKH